MTTTTAIEGDLRRELASLPEPPLPAALWERVAGARRRQVARRRATLGGALVLVVAILALPGTRPGDAPDSAGNTNVATHAGDARLRTLDRELQAAYRRGSGEAEIAQLWRQRAALVRDRRADPPLRPTRI